MIAVSQSITEDMAKVHVTEAMRAREATITPARKSDAIAEFLIFFKKRLITGTKIKDGKKMAIVAMIAPGSPPIT